MSIFFHLTTSNTFLPLKPVEMRIAISGTSDLSKYFVKQFLKASQEAVILARGPRERFRPLIFVRYTDYSIPSLLQHLHDCNVLAPAIQDTSVKNFDAHLALLDACK